MADKKPKDNQTTSIKALEERINTIGRAVLGNENFGKVMNSAVTTSSRVQRGFSDQMARQLHFYNMPSQDDVVRLSEQCARIEERVVRIETAIMQLTNQSAAQAGPPRTRRPKKTKTDTATSQPKRTKSAKKE
ncbi:MAG: hypothetical protein AAF996_13935 [Pseudomonadota bacterium]